MSEDRPDHTLLVHVRTLEADNLVIDKLTAGAYTENRRTLSNNGTVASMYSVGTTTYRGKFFPRGCRGYITTVEIYCDNTDTVDHTLTVKLSPFPGMGPVTTATLTVSAGTSASWQAVTISKLWSYDSLFIWIIADDATYPRAGYDSGTPYDYYSSTDELTWTTGLQRQWFRVNMHGQTVGDIPVSGTINTIPVPYMSSVVDIGTVAGDGGTTFKLFEIEGSGKVEWMWFRFRPTIGAVAENEMFLRITVDGIMQELSMVALTGYVNEATNTPTPITFVEIDNTTPVYTFWWKKLLEFRQHIKVEARNGAAAGNFLGVASVYSAAVL